MRISLAELNDNRLSIKYCSVDGIFKFGDDNAYPQLVNSLIDTSVTAKNCSDLNAKYIAGKGFSFTKGITDKTSLIVNKKGYNINELLRICSKEFSRQNNIFLLINYNALFEVTSVELLPTNDVRIGKSDSTGYSGKYVVYSNWDKSKGKRIDRNDFVFIDKFNPIPSVIETQIEAAGGFKFYKGQILHLKSDFSDTYSVSDIDPVLFECDSEHRASIFRNTALRKGFFGDKLIVTKPFEDQEEKREFRKFIGDFVGVENQGIIHIEAKNETDDLTKEFHLENIDSNIDDKRFANTELAAAENIRQSFNVPSILIKDSDNSIFGQSGALLKEAKLMHWENKEEERNIIVEAFQTIFSKFHYPINPTNDWTITPIIEIKPNEQNSNSNGSQII